MHLRSVVHAKTGDTTGVRHPILRCHEHEDGLIWYRAERRKPATNADLSAAKSCRAVAIAHPFQM
jgi:hypothetical protein